MKDIKIVAGDHLANLDRCGGVYRAVVDPTTQSRVTPIVGYAGKYETPDGQRAWVGDVYYNFAMAEGYPAVLGEFANCLMRQSQAQFSGGVDCILGAPMGGIALSFALAEQAVCHFAFAEKKVLAAATLEAREQSELVLDRHTIRKGWRVVLGEDVCNNFSTTKKLIELVKARGAEVVAIACAINRSMSQDSGELLRVYDDGQGLVIPVLSALEIPTKQYHQDDPAVVEDIKADNVVWKPKNEWDRLIAEMRAAEEFIKG